MIAAAAKELGVECPLWDLTRGMIRVSAGAAPRLRVKAAEARYMLPITRHILAHYFPTQSDHESLRLHTVEAMLRMYQEVDSWGPGSSERLGRSCREFMTLYHRLRSTATSEVLWTFYPKFHLLVHVCESGENPRSTWNYADEREIGLAAKTAENMHPGTLGTVLIAKHRVAKYGVS